mgnify:CR=1 FL=1
MELYLIKIGYSLYIYILDQIKRLTIQEQNQVIDVLLVLLFSKWVSNHC